MGFYAYLSIDLGSIHRSCERNEVVLADHQLVAFLRFSDIISSKLNVERKRNKMIEASFDRQEPARRMSQLKAAVRL